MNKQTNRPTVLFATLCIVLLGISVIPAQTKSVTPAPVSKEQRAVIESIIYDYLLENPSVVRQALQNLAVREEQEKSDAVARNLAALKSEIYAGGGSVSLGKTDADVPVVVFFDYFCGYCRKTLPALQNLIAKDKSIRVIYKQLPILGPQSMTAAHAALAAARQGKFAEFHLELLTANGVDETELKAISDRLGLDFGQLKKDMGSADIIAEIARTSRLAETLDIAGTPAYLVGDRIIPGAIDSEALSKIVASERQKLLATDKGAASPTGK
jgi:protein-disulfide isomerase